MQESLMTNNNNEDNKEKKLLKDAKKMHYIKYLNLFFSILRTVLEFYQIINNIEFAFYFLFNIFLLIVLFHLFIILPISAIINLIKTFRRIFTRNYSISKNVENIYDYIGYTCCGCCGNDNSNNVTFSKYSNLIYGLITLFLSSFSLFFFLKDRIYYSNKYKNAPFLSDEQRKQLIIIILYLIDSIILLIQSYFFHFHDYFLRRGEIYIEFYKRLIIKNRKEEAEFVRNQLPRYVKDFVINSGHEMQNMTV